MMYPLATESPGSQFTVADVASELRVAATFVGAAGAVKSALLEAGVSPLASTAVTWKT